MVDDTTSATSQVNPTVVTENSTAVSSQSQGNPKERRTMNFDAPKEFDFSQPAEWQMWRNRFERFISISGDDKKSEQEKINTLMYAMGEKSEKIFPQFPPPIPMTLAETLDSFTRYFEPKVNVIFERFCFNTRNQKAGESADEFITIIHRQ